MNKQQNKQKLKTTHIYIHISCKCDTNRAGHFTLDAHASRPVACLHSDVAVSSLVIYRSTGQANRSLPKPCTADVLVGFTWTLTHSFWCLTRICYRAVQSGHWCTSARAIFIDNKNIPQFIRMRSLTLPMLLLSVWTVYLVTLAPSYGE